MRPILLIDFGSTYTKVVAVDLSTPRVLGTARAATTAATDISDGLLNALGLLYEKTGQLAFEARLACSSAAGGLKMVACGLVPSLTAQAAKLAAYGAGAKVIKTYAYTLTRSDLKEIDTIQPDILLLTGGTDGGNTEVILHNAKALAGLDQPFPIVYAGNRAARDECADILGESSHPFYAADNVMPTLNVLQTTQTQQVIREIFLERIIQCKGLSRAREILDGIMMPTPSAVLTALTLLAKGVGKRKGVGELVAVDLGGATTDIYSIADGEPSMPGTVVRGLPEPHIKRTVEGDIGMRFSARGTVEAAGYEEVERLSGLAEGEVNALLDRMEAHPGMLAREAGEIALDHALAVLATRIGLTRHSGRIKQVYTPMGALYQQTGKDLTRVERLILAGGALTVDARDQAIAAEALSVRDAESLVPRRVKIAADRQQLLPAMGLLAGYDREAAFGILCNIFGKEEEYATLEQKMG